MNRKLTASLPLASLAAALLASTLAGCAPMVIGGAAAAAGATIMMNDRRSSGAQIDDETIEFRTSSRLSDAFGDKAHIAVASYNRQVLLTGEVPTEAARQQAEQIAAKVDTVRGVVNELAVMPPSSLTQRSNDTYITGKVRASFVDASDLQAQAFRVVTERGTVYLMGRVSPREADRGTTIARQISGVQRVVRVLEVMTPEEMRQAGVPAKAGSSTPTAAPVSTAGPNTGPAPSAEAEPPAVGGAVATPVR